MFGAVGSHPVAATGAAARLRGRPLTDEVIAEVADEASRLAKPLDNTDFQLGYRKRLARRFVTEALKELRGDGPARVPTSVLVPLP